MNKPELIIAGRRIGYNHKPLVIAEIGINHGGCLQVAKEMVNQAIQSGAEVIKHQTHIVDDEMCSAAKLAVPEHTEESIYDIIQTCALSEACELELQQYTESQGAIYISTPFSRKAADRLNDMGVPAFKIGSGECNNYPLIKHIAQFNKPVILSSGMNDIESIRPSVQILRENRIPYALLHCTNIYPTPHELVRLESIRQLQEAFPDSVVGLSDHTIDNYACLGAVALGASILERHFTDSDSRKGPDISCSMTPESLKELIHGANIIQLERGGKKAILSEEKSTIDFAYASVVTIKSIKKDDVFTEDNLWVKRPGSGDFKAKDYYSILGKKAKNDISSDVLLKRSDVEII